MSEMTPGDDGSYVNPHSGEPLEDSWLHDRHNVDSGADAWAEMKPIPVKVTHSDTEQVAPEATSFLSYAVPLAANIGGTGTLQPLQVCPHRYRRYKAKFLFTNSTASAITIYVDKVPDKLMSNALGTVFQINIAASQATSVALMPEYDGSQPLYMVASAAGVTVNVMDEGYKTVQ